MFRYEWKKLLHYRRGMIFIVLFLLAELLGVLFFTQPYDRDLEANREVYDDYLAQVEGPLTPEKRDFMEGEMKRLSTVRQKMERLKFDYYSGAVTEDEYRRTFEELVEDDSAYAGFAKLYSQYIFVRASEVRSFLYTGGWEVLLGDQKPDYLFLLLLVFLLTPVFCQEYGNQMDQILLTQKKSARCQWQVKLLTALTLTAGLTAILQLMLLVYCAVAYGLPHWDDSLQSIMSFGDTGKAMTLWQAFLLQFALKEVGYLYCALLILFFSVLFRKYNLTLMAGLAVLPLPFLTMNANHVFLRIPGPWALTLGSIYLNPSEGYWNPNTGEKVITTPEMTWQELGILLVCVMAIAGVLVGIIRAKNTNHHAKGRTPRLMGVMMAAVLLLSGCGAQQKSVVYNTQNARWFENGAYVFFSYGFDQTVMIDKQTGKVRPFPLSSTVGETDFVAGYFYEENGDLYYLKTTSLHPNGGDDSTASLNVIARMALDTMQESVCYQWGKDRVWFFGLLDLPVIEEDPGYVEQFFLHGSHIYYLSNGALYRMNRFTGAYELYVTPDHPRNIAYDGQSVYYMDAYNRLVLRNLDTGKERAAEEVVAETFVLTPEGVYFLSRRDNNTLYYWDEAHGKAVKLDDTPAYELFWDEHYLWVTSNEDLSLYRVNHDGTGRTAVECGGYVCAVPTGGKLYFEDYTANRIYQVDKDTLQVSVLMTGD